MRDEVRQLIGDEAELLVWLFCMMRRETLILNQGGGQDFSVQHRLTGEPIPLSDTQFQDLVTMTFANSLEAFPRCSWDSAAKSPQTPSAFSEHRYSTSPNAFDRIDAHWWEFWK